MKTTREIIDMITEDLGFHTIYTRSDAGWICGSYDPASDAIDKVFGGEY